MQLNSPVITELTPESAAYNLLLEWLGDYFDGTSDHCVGTNMNVSFPKVNLACGQSPVKQPLNDPAAGVDAEIRIVILPRREQSENLDTAFFSGRLVTSNVMLQFTASAKHPGKDGSYSEQSAQRIGELLHAILANPEARYPLTQNGFRNFQPLHPQWIPAANYAKRMVSCGAQLQYPVQFNAQPPVTPDELSLEFTNEEPLIVGNTLLGQYQWATRTVTLESVSATFWPSQGQDTVLGLVVGGVLTDFTLTLPQGTANVNQSVVNVPIDMKVSAPQIIQWQVLSGPAAPAAAWHVVVNVVAK